MRLFPVVLLAACHDPAPSLRAPTPPVRAVLPLLTHDPVQAGGGATRLSADLLEPGDRAYFIGGASAGAGPCSGRIGGRCVGVVGPRTLGSAVANASGHAEIVANLPGSLSQGQQIALQIVVPRGVGGADSVLSLVATPTVGVNDADGDGFDTASDCNDQDPAVHPGAVELCNGIEDDCDPTTSEDGRITVGSTNYASIDDAAYFSPPGATIAVCAGTYDESVRIERGMRLIGIDGADLTTIDASGLGLPTLDLAGAGTYEIEGLTITGGNSGVRISQSVDLTMRHSVITGNHAVGDSGGGIDDESYYWSPASVWLEDVEVSYNTSDWEGGGLFLANGANTLVDVRVLFNQGISGGGGMFVGYYTTLTTITGCTFHGNEAGGTGFDGGGAILINREAGDVVVTDSDFGVGANENLPDDVYLYDFNTPVSYSWFQDGESFTCSTTSHTCQ